MQIAYATRAKKVDVRKLKAQMWRDVEATAVESDFAAVVNRVGAQQRQSDVTMPFYFICLLHLCNEKTLALNADGLKNFAVSTEGRRRVLPSSRVRQVHAAIRQARRRSRAAMLLS